MSVLLAEGVRSGSFVLVGFQKHTGAFVLEQKGCSLAAFALYIVHESPAGTAINMLQPRNRESKRNVSSQMKHYFSSISIKRNADFYYGVCTCIFQKFYILSVVELQGVYLHSLLHGCLTLEF